MDRKKRPRQQGGRQGGASWSRQKKAKSRPELPRSLMKELGYQQKDEDTSTVRISYTAGPELLVFETKGMLDTPNRLTRF